MFPRISPTLSPWQHPHPLEGGDWSPPHPQRLRLEAPWWEGSGHEGPSCPVLKGLPQVQELPRETGEDRRRKSERQETGGILEALGTGAWCWRYRGMTEWESLHVGKEMGAMLAQREGLLEEVLCEEVNGEGLCPAMPIQRPPTCQGLRGGHTAGHQSCSKHQVAMATRKHAQETEALDTGF